MLPHVILINHLTYSSYEVASGGPHNVYCVHVAACNLRLALARAGAVPRPQSFAPPIQGQTSFISWRSAVTPQPSGRRDANRRPVRFLPRVARFVNQPQTGPGFQRTWEVSIPRGRGVGSTRALNRSIMQCNAMQCNVWLCRVCVCR